MLLNYRIESGEGSYSLNNTTGAAARRLPFFVTNAGHYIAGKEYFTEREGLEGSCLLFHTLSGRGRLRYRGGEWELLPGQACVINCSEYQHYATASAEPWDFKWMHIGGAAAEYEDRINAGSLRRVPLGEASAAAQAVDGVLALLRDGTDRLADVKICGLVAAALTEMAVGAQRPAWDRTLRHGEMEEAAAYIRAHYAQIGSIDEIVGRTHLSKFHFLRLFKAYSGLGLYEYLNSCRVGAAMELLRAEGCKVGAAARAVGFNDVNCFIRYFKKVAGVTPSVYRKYCMY